jgi:O-antigen ligase
MSEAAALTFPPAIAAPGLVRVRVRAQREKWVYLFLWLFTIAVYARPEDIFPLLAPVHLTFVFGFCAGVAYLVARSSGVRVTWTSELRIVLLLSAWYLVGLPFALWKGGSFQVLVHVWLKTVLIFFLLTQTLPTLGKIRGLLWAIILSELVVTGFSVIETSKVIWVGGRLLGVSQGILGWNFLGIAAATTIPYIAALFVVRRSLTTTIVLIAASVSMLSMLVQTASRGGLLTVVFSVGLTVVLVLRSSVRGRLIAVAIVLAVLVAVALAPRILWQRLETVLNSSGIYSDQVAASAAESQEDHIAVLTRSIQYTLEHPIFGLGLGNFQVASGTWLNQPSAWVGTHNTFTEVSSEAGIPALVMFVGLLVTAVRNMRRVSRVPVTSLQGPELNLMARATLASLLAFAFGAFFVHLAYEYYFFYQVAIAAAIRRLARTGSPSSANRGMPAPVLRTMHAPVEQTA